MHDPEMFPHNGVAWDVRLFGGIVTKQFGTVTAQLSDYLQLDYLWRTGFCYLPIRRDGFRVGKQFVGLLLTSRNTGVKDAFMEISGVYWECECCRQMTPPEQLRCVGTQYACPDCTAKRVVADYQESQAIARSDVTPSEWAEAERLLKSVTHRAA